MRRSDREIKEFDKIVEVMRKCDVCRVAINDEKFHTFYHLISVWMS